MRVLRPAVSHAGRFSLSNLQAPVRPDLHRRLKIRAAETDLTLEATCRLAFEQFLGTVQPSFPRSILP